jgi:uncharacterized protein
MQRPSPFDRLLHLSQRCLDHLVALMPYFLIGILIAAVTKTWIPMDALSRGDGPLSGPLLMMAAAVVLSLCAEADAFIAAGFSGFAPSSLIAFLVLGPMLDIKLLLMYRQIFTWRMIAAFIIVLPLLVLGWCLALGWSQALDAGVLP